ncbi:hypothetical protein CERSUDRAFT_103104 [Gelatoporia subvermispora B]|uniref:Mid2 domain-containing protein n=1 Tax=Ceriporiopsis subvermispora (strain B) TaxID=914234 RepID=M2RPC1_CERS8|nr:hypothetical protein CERSUDRAFT_103104 [Gelatoporia subvermispora B]
MYNASTMWLIGDSLLFYQTGLDPTQPHTIELANTGPNGMALSLNSITVWAPNTTVANPSVSRTSATGGSHSSNKVAEIVGPIVGVIGVIIICASLLAFRKYRRRRPLPPHEEVTPYPPMLSMEKASAMPDRDIHPNSSTVPLHSGGIWRKAAPVVSQPAAVSRAPSAVPSNRPPESNNGVAVSRAVSSRVSAAHTQEGSSHPSQSQAGMVNVDRIIELIAQRIDRSSALPISEDPLAPPPQYPADPADAYTQ